MHEINEFGQVVGRAIEDWIPRLAPIKSALNGNHCILQPLDISKHANALFNILGHDSHNETWTYLPFGPFATLAAFTDMLKSKIASPDTLLYAVVDVKTHQALGISGYLRINPEHGTIEIGSIHFSKLMKRTTLATEAIYLMMRHVFVDLGYRRCEWKCNALNAASRLAAARFGFKFEGIFRQSAVYKARNRDTAWFSVLDSEWPSLNSKFQKWLNRDNFDASGKQIMELSQC